MTSSTTNPFALPGFGQFGDASQNPMMASVEMMRQAWQNLAGAGAGALTGGTMVAPPMGLEELDRRINELRTVENWLRLNLSMLSSTIQGMEVQRATIATIKSFVVPVADSAADAPSALEVALGLKPSGQARIRHSHEASAAKPSASSSSGQPGGAATPAGAAVVGSPDAWWGMLQQQFEQLASATAASLKGAERVVAADGSAASAAAQSAASSSSSVSSGLGESGAFVAPGSSKPASAARKTSSSSTAKRSGPAAKTTSSAPRAPRKRAAPKSGA